MSVDSATLTTASGILKNNYEGPIVDQINNPNALMAEVDKNTKDIVQGSKIVMAVRMRPTQAIGSRADLGVLPGAQASNYQQPTEVLRNLYGVIRVTGPLMAASKTDKGAFIRAIRAEAEGLTTALNLDQNRQAFGNAKGDGTICLCGTTTASLTVQLAATANMLYFEIGMLVDLLTQSSGAAIANGTKREIVAMDQVNKTITLDTAGSTVTTDATVAIYRNGNYNVELNGLEALLGTGILHSIDPSVAGNERWKANVNAAFGAWSSIKFQDMVDTCHNNSGKWISHIFSQQGPRNAYLQELTALRRIVSQGDAPTKKLNGGFIGLAYTGGGSEAVWVKDPYAPDATSVYGIHMPLVELKQAEDWGFIEMPGAPGVYWLPDILGSSGVDAYKAVMRKYCNLVTKQRNAHLKCQAVTY